MKTAMKIGISLLSAVTLSSVYMVGTKSFDNSELDYVKADSTRQLLLDSTTISDLDDTPKSGSFSTLTESNNPVRWTYNNAKRNNNGLITLSRTYKGNNLGDEAYIANIDPITRLETIQINYSGSDGYLTLFGSIDGVNYERVTTITPETTSINQLDHYFYVKIASGEQNKADLKIENLTIHYSCDSSKYIKDARDAINDLTYFSKDNDLYAATIQNVEVFDSNRSSTALKWTDNLSGKYKYAYLTLYRTFSIEELAHSRLSIRVKTNNAKLGDSKGTTFITDFYYNSFSGAVTSTIYPYFNLNNEGWKLVEADLSNLTFTNPVNRIRICVNDIVTEGEIYIDDIHIYSKNSYPNFAFDYLDYADEKDDLINNGIANESSTICSDFYYGYLGSKGERSLGIYMSGGYNFARLSALYNVELSGKIIKFEYIHEGSNSIFLGVYKKVDTENRYYYIDVSKNRTGIVVNNIIGLDGRTWKSVEFDVDVACAASSSYKKENSSYQGIRHTGAAETTYIDNLVIESK